VILNAHTNGLSAYDAYWSKMMWSLSESYYDAASIAPSAIAAGDMILGTYVDRRGLDWNGGKSAWMHAVSGNTKFDDGAGTLNSSITGTQFGLDLLALGDPSTRAGVTFGYTSQSTDIVLPDGMTSGGSTEGRLPSIGGYLTHADDKFYSDLLSQYRFINYDVNAPTSTGKVSGGAVDVVAEAGLHFGGGPITITPLGQLSYQHLMLDDTTLGGSDVDFGDSDSLIGRARLLLQANMAGFKAYASAGVSSDLLGDQKTTVDGTDFNTNTGGARGEFAAGLEASLGGLSVFGSGEYDVSFDGNSTTYAGRGGFRAGF
jgi:type V secretory pathway adhesin AidA